MRPALGLLSALFVLSVCAAPAFAETAGLGAGELPPMFAELEAGVSVPSFEAYGTVGLSTRAAVGLGVPLDGLTIGGMPVALFVTASFTWSHFADTQRTSFHTADLVNDSFVYALGFRGVLYPSENLEVLLDIQGGYRRSASSAAIDGREGQTMTEGHALPILGAGLRYRFLEVVTAGLRWETQLIQPLDGPDVPATAAGFATPRGERWQMNIMLTAALHF